MSRRVVLRPQVPDDLHAIMARLEQGSAAVADRFLESAFAAFEGLAQFPGKGSPKHFRLARLAGLRSWAVPGFPNHLIYYLTTDDAVIVYAVIHGARRVQRLLGDRLP